MSNTKNWPFRNVERRMDQNKSTNPSWKPIFQANNSFECSICSVYSWWTSLCRANSKGQYLGKWAQEPPIVFGLERFQRRWKKGEGCPPNLELLGGFAMSGSRKLEPRKKSKTSGKGSNLVKKVSLAGQNHQFCGPFFLIQRGSQIQGQAVFAIIWMESTWICDWNIYNGSLVSLARWKICQTIFESKLVRQEKAIYITIYVWFLNLMEISGNLLGVSILINPNSDLEVSMNLAIFKVKTWISFESNK